MRYLPLTDSDRLKMLETIKASSVDELFSDVPKKAYEKAKNSIKLDNHKSEIEVEKSLKEISKKNLSSDDMISFLGAGSYRHYIPSTVDYLIQRGEFLTSYTPYQPEVSQGTLQVIYEFQTQISLMTRMEVANASMYDGATACAEAVSMASRITKKNKTILSGALHPEYKETTKTFVQYIDIECEELSPDFTNSEDIISKIDDKTSSVVVQYPCFFGNLRDYSDIAKACHEKGALLIVAITEPLALGVLTPPGDMGADIVVGEGYSLASSSNFGGPCVGFFATKKKYVRNMPGRVVGETTDTQGKKGYVLTLATREQHIRRERATSNICTNSGLVATAFSIHMAMLGEKGFHNLAMKNHHQAVKLYNELSELKNIEILNKSFFNELTIKLPIKAREAIDKILEKNIFAGVDVSRFYPSSPELENLLLVSITELNSNEDIKKLKNSLKEVL